MKTDSMHESHERSDKHEWIGRLKSHVKRNRLAVLRFSESEWENIIHSLHGTTRFTVARPRVNGYSQKMGAPTACVIMARELDEPTIYFGILKSIFPVTTLESRFKIVRSQALSPISEDRLIQLVDGETGPSWLGRRLQSLGSLVPLGPVTSARLVDVLARNRSNWSAMRTVERSLSTGRVYSRFKDVQSDAINTALKVFGLSMDESAKALDLFNHRETTLDQFRISEDSVIEHDAKFVSGLELEESDLTGRAVFVNNTERLEVFTANRRPLENLFGVDLIYVNSLMGNVVMVQYKMLEREESKNKIDWIFRPDEQFQKETDRMRRWVENTHSTSPSEYRLNNEVFYLKFVKRNAKLGRAPIVIPMAHFENLKTDPSSRGPHGGFRISYDDLSGRYLRQQTFLDLIRYGYIGADSRTTTAYRSLIEEVLSSGRGIVAALQTARRLASDTN